MKKLFEKIKNLIPTKRRLIQLYAALLTNANVKGFAEGKIYTGSSKKVCVPGLNCYSCPGAVGACPLGSLQNSLAAANKGIPYYVFGIILLYAIIFGRTVCGFLCPFGLIQDLVYMIKSPKLCKNRVTKLLSYLKFVILIVFVFIFPIVFIFEDRIIPAFCKYICPAGTLGGAVPLLSGKHGDSFLDMLGPLFTWKFILLAVIIVACIFIYRAFCRFLCPLGALYGLFNKISVLGVKLDRSSCIECGKCFTACKVDISSVGDVECISCGDCVSVCPTKAISYSGSRIFLRENDIPDTATDDEREEIEKKNARKRKVFKIIAGVTALAVLLGSLVYFNIIDRDDTPDNSDGTNDGTDNSQGSDESPRLGNKVGNLCYSEVLSLVDGTGEVSVESLRGKITVINFWGTWCDPCMAELPYFDRVADEYSDTVAVLAIHTSYPGNVEPDVYIADKYSESKMIFALDKEGKSGDEYYTALGGTGAYPMTVILDTDGVITFVTSGAMHYEDLVREIEKINK